jgi:hypothetical protein
MGYRSASNIKKPSEQLADLMMGRATWDDSPDAIKSWAQRFIYDAAKQILAAEKPKRQAMLMKVPPHMQAMVEAEIKRLWSIRPR